MLQNTHLFCGLQFTNNGELDKFLITNHHTAIISAEIFSKVQELKNLRSKEPKEEMTMTFSY